MPFSGFDKFNPLFSDALQRMIAARPGISVFSGHRTNEQQAKLFADKLAELGGNVAAARRVVAPPIGLYGSKGSRHTHGIAADLAYASAEDRAWAHENAGKYGLNFRMGHEPWHIELINGKQEVVAGPDPNAPTSNKQYAENGTYKPYVPYNERPREVSDEPYFTPADPVINVNQELAATDFSMDKLGSILKLAELMSPKGKKTAKEIQMAKNLERISSYS